MRELQIEALAGTLDLTIYNDVRLVDADGAPGRSATAARFGQPV